MRRRRADGTFMREHGAVGTPEHNSWRAIIARCCNPLDKNYPRYGGRGITVCNRWRFSFETFLADVGRRPTENHSLDRYPNNNGHYEPGNVRWATRRQQSQNRRDSRILEHHGERLNLIEWARKLGMRQSTLWQRLKSGWNITRALDTPVRGASR